jgi:predicted negative regulator of RcsB-dependent stress response
MTHAMVQEYSEKIIVRKQGFKISKKTIAIIVGTVVAVTILAVLFLYRQEQNNIKASNLYNQTVIAIQQQDTVAVTNNALALIKNYKNSPYARLAGLFLAKIAFEENNIDLAKERLNWVITASANDHSLRPIAVARLARLLVHNKEYDAAIALIDQQKFPARFAVVLEEVRGDALLAKGERDAAMESYKIVAQNLPEKVDVKWLEEKLNDLGVEKNVVEAKSNKDN